MNTRSIGNRLDERNVRGIPNPNGSSYPSGTLWPHGEWSFGYGKSRPDDGDPDRPCWKVSDSALEAQHTPDLAGWLPLDLSDAANSHTPRRRGTKGMSGYGQQMIKAGGHLMEQRYPHHRKTLGTVTLPSMSHEARCETVAVWPEIVRQLLQWQGRKLKRLGLPPIVLSVTEIQPKRLVESGEACLHLHQLWLNAPEGAGHWSFDPNEIRSYVDSLLRRLVSSYTGGFVNVDLKPVTGTVAAYLAKYMSKGKQMVAEALEDWGEDNCPRTWWNMTKPARDMVKAATLKGREVGELLERTLELSWGYGLDDVYAFLRHIEVRMGDVMVGVGWRGRFHPAMTGYLTGVLKSFHMEGFAEG